MRLQATWLEWHRVSMTKFMLAARASLQRHSLTRQCSKRPCRARARTCGRRLCGPSGTVLTHCARGRPVLSSSTHWRLPEKATSAGAPHRPHTHLAPGRAPPQLSLCGSYSSRAPFRARTASVNLKLALEQHYKDKS